MTVQPTVQPNNILNVFNIPSVLNQYEVKNMNFDSLFVPQAFILLTRKTTN